VTDWMKPGVMPPDSVSDDVLVEDDEVLRDEMNPPTAPATGGYGTVSGRPSSGGSGEGSENASNAGDDDQTDWLREAPGRADDR
jgi:hypothetical protein